MYFYYRALELYVTFLLYMNLTVQKTGSGYSEPLPYISFIRGVFDMITESFEHSTGCRYLPAVEYL